MYKILLVDDESEIRNALANYFPWSSLGYEVAHDCKNGKDALDILTTQKVDVLFSDICMPLMSGLELAEEVVKRGIPLKIVFLSGYRDFQYAKKAINLGVYEYIVKPSKFDELHSVFSSLKTELDQQNSERNIDTANNKTTINYSDNIIATIKDYVNTNYDTVTLNDISNIVHMSSNYISTYFKEKTNQNFSDYVHMVRMKKAADLLGDFRYKTYEVSNIVGYSNPKNFTRMFKKYYGKSPRDYRNSKEDF